MIYYLLSAARIVFGRLLFVLIASVGVSSANAQSYLRIDSPVQSAKLSPGAIISVGISASADIESVYVKFGDFTLSGFSDKKPFEVSLSVPATYQGMFTIGAIGFRANGSSVVANLVRVEVAEVSPQGGTIVSTVGGLTLSFPGDRARLPFEIKLNGGRTKRIGVESMAVRTFPEGVISVVGNDIFAIASGEASLQVSYGDSTASLPVSVKSVSRGDLNGDGLVDLGDISVFHSLPINTASTGSNDARDLNRDGKVNALDLRVLTTLCSRPRCAAQ